ncbi:MAG TPA: hypothetical protein VM056_06600 [Terriglobales bacterium]|nr:hypothetical protein [Terriglobales bacterium]
MALALIALSLHAQKKPKTAMAMKPEQAAAVENAEKDFIPAQQPCQNYGWAALVEVLLKQQKVAIPQKNWVMKAYGGYKCISPVRDYTALQRFIDGDYALGTAVKGSRTPNDLRKIRVETEFIPGAPSAADAYIVRFREGQPVMLIWNGHPYLWYGLVYDEYVHSNGSRMFEMRELKLLDPLAKSKKEQVVTFVKGKDDPAQINGVMVLRVTAR